MLDVNWRNCEWEKVGMWEFSVLSAQFSVKPKTVLKKSINYIFVLRNVSNILYGKVKRTITTYFYTN